MADFSQRAASRIANAGHPLKCGPTLRDGRAARKRDGRAAAEQSRDVMVREMIEGIVLLYTPLFC